MDKLVDKYTIAENFSCTPSAAVKLMKYWKVPTIYLGPGRGLGYRWREQDVEAIVNAREIGNLDKKKNTRKKKSSIFNLTTKEFMEKYG